ncbi:hypothetical protein P171DRAFT_56495 [Karstenula rhodostoma CBS 690.94]|uniref:Uncharacterized protein n=1 Tax=Karstenula rhodostoma CBS 690.94 TaxID=1392251 RepID=A0A9P4PFG3_9PLEO|nr:hypothetical protein P171DRAFT_56495 [Karstenula rhodostoma CBS 690.94]
MQNQSNAPFPFMQLPPELRDMVYENLLEDPHYPPPRPCPKTRGPSWLSSMAQLGSGSSTDTETTSHKSNFLFLASKQIYAEYMDLMCKKTTFHMTVAPHNYTPPAAPAEEEEDIWQISPQVLKKMKRCDIKLVTTSTMLGVSDPRNMKPEEWALARQMRRQLSEVENISELNLHVKAIGDPLWNPLWVWYHATEALREMGSSSDHGNEYVKVDVVDGELGSVASSGSGPSGPSGPQFNRITFSLDMWSPGENYLMRDRTNNNQWAWWCLKGHCVGQVGPELTVRQFCSWLYDCPTCYSEENDDDK